jgi:endo-1,4-beta-xylanase
MTTRREFLISSLAAAAASRKQQNATPAVSAQASAPSTPAATIDASGANSLRAHAAARNLLVGCAVSPQLLSSQAQYATLVAEHASILVPENAMKWGALRPAPDAFDFTAADQIMAFAAMHGQIVRGHNLCWHEALPAWFAAIVTKENARHFLSEHIKTVCGHFTGEIQAWDVVNEAIDPASTRPDGLRDSPWLELAGDDYVALAFRTARAADLHALLTYNDYGIELASPGQVAKRDHVLALVKRLHSESLIDAVGIQSHLGSADAVAGNLGGLVDFVRELGAMNLKVFITELDVNERTSEGSVAQRDALVAQIYRDYLGTVLGEPNVTAVLTWGITDRYSWLNGAKYARADGMPQRPLPFDADYQPSPAFFAERDAIDAIKPR